ncbi:MAG TPA: hypothetical protein VFF44_13595 [Casimicrobiaceae bacterium]|nr:hypothetical protein [Casimicrobiaceae bacterium]
MQPFTMTNTALRAFIPEGDDTGREDRVHAPGRAMTVHDASLPDAIAKKTAPEGAVHPLETADQ